MRHINVISCGNTHHIEADRAVTNNGILTVYKELTEVESENCVKADEAAYTAVAQFHDWSSWRLEEDK